MFEFLDPIVDASNDPLVHLKYIVAAAHLKRHKEVVRLCKGTPVFDPAAVITCLIEAKLPDAFLLIHICDLFGYVDEMTTYLFNNNLQYEVEDYLRTCPGPEALKVLGKLMDLKCSDTILSKLIALLGHRVSIVEVIHAAESRNALCSVRPWLEKIAWRSVDPVVHTAMAKIYIMLNDKPLQFLHSNLYYDSLTVGTFFEKSHPYFACAAYARANGKCDAQLLRVAQENNDYKNLTRYLIQRQDMVLWQKALIPDNYKPGDPTPISRRSLVSEVICVLPEIQVYNEVFAIANAYSQCNMIEENIQLLECVVSSGGKFAKDPHLQTLLIRTAIQFKKEKVVGYINCLSFFDGPVLAEVAVKPENALYEEALVIYLKLSQNIWSVDRTRYCIAAVDVLINHLGDLNRAREFAQQVNVKEVHSRVIHAQNQALRAPPVAKVAAVQPAPPAPLAPLAPPAPPILPAASVCAEMPSSWLVVRLLANGFDVELVKDCDQKLVVKEGFISESDFADCPPNEFDAAYLSSVGISAKGIQRHLIRLQGELHIASKPTSPVPPSQQESSVRPAPLGSPTPQDKPSQANVEILQGQSTPDDSAQDPEYCPSVLRVPDVSKVNDKEDIDCLNDPMFVPTCTRTNV